MRYGKEVHTLCDRQREVRNNRHAARQANRREIQQQFDEYLNSDQIEFQLEAEERDRLEYLDFHANGYEYEYDESGQIIAQWDGEEWRNDLPEPYNPLHLHLVLDAKGQCHNLRFYTREYNFICDEDGVFEYL